MTDAIRRHPRRKRNEVVGNIPKSCVRWRKIICISPLMRTEKLMGFESAITSGWLDCQNVSKWRKRDRKARQILCFV